VCKSQKISLHFLFFLPPHFFLLIEDETLSIVLQFVGVLPSGFKHGTHTLMLERSHWRNFKSPHQVFSKNFFVLHCTQTPEKNKRMK